MRASVKAIICSLAACVLVIGAPATAQQVLIEWGPNCFGWETDYEGHISNPGSELTLLGRIDLFYEPLDFLDADAMEYTFIFEELVSLGTEVIGGIIFVTVYEGGTFRIYEDATPDFDFGIYPPNETAPATFVDGELIFEGTLADFEVTLIDDGQPPGATGSATANWVITGGSLFDTIPGAFGPMLGVWTDDPNVVPIPEGYTCHLDGKFDLGGYVATRPDTWGAIKQLYR